jgi:hypothetical protein
MVKCLSVKSVYKDDMAAFIDFEDQDNAPLDKQVTKINFLN